MSESISKPQEYLPQFEPKDNEAIGKQLSNGKKNNILNEDLPVHGWYRFILSYPPHLVRNYLQKFKVNQNQVVLDPFSGTGTTLVEAKLNGIKSIGIEANPFAHFSGSVKTDWDVDPEHMLRIANSISENVSTQLDEQGIDDNGDLNYEIGNLPLRGLDEPIAKLLIKNSISPLPLHKVLILIDCLEEYSEEPCFSHLRLALAKTLVFSVSNLRFGPEVGVGKIKADAPLLLPWMMEVEAIANDVRSITNHSVAANNILGDSRSIEGEISDNSIDAVITSPPYPNEKDYSRTTRLESVLLGFMNSRQDLRRHKKNFVRSNTRGVYKDDDDHLWIEDNKHIHQVANKIEKRRLELGKTSGFEKLYPKVTRQYFGGMSRHLSQLTRVLRPNAHLAYVVGDQASYLRVMIRTGQLLADIATRIGYQVEGIDLFRTRYATATREELREEVVILRWPG